MKSRDFVRRYLFTVRYRHWGYRGGSPTAVQA